MVQSITEFAGDEPLHAHGHGGFDYVDLVRDSLHADGADDGVLAPECVLQGREGVVGFDNFDVGWEVGRGVGPGEDRDGEGGREQGFYDVAAEVSRTLGGVSMGVVERGETTYADYGYILDVGHVLDGPDW